MRDLVLSYQTSAVRFIVPELVPNHLPEMTCFRLDECDCLSYGTDEEKVRTLLHGGEAPLVKENIKRTHSALDSAQGQPSSHQQPYQPSQRAHVRVQVCPQALSTQQAEGSPCAVTNYKRVITGSCPGEPEEAMPSQIGSMLWIGPHTASMAVEKRQRRAGVWIQPAGTRIH